jgi:hypothetical protein
MPYFGEWFGDLSGNLVAPVIASVTPTPSVVPGGAGGFSADYAVARVTPVVIDVTDVSPGLQRVVMWVRYSDTPYTMVVYDGTNFLWPFDTTTSTKVAVANGYRFTVLPRDGWPSANLEWHVGAVDSSGNEAA